MRPKNLPRHVLGSVASAQAGAGRGREASLVVNCAEKPIPCSHQACSVSLQTRSGLLSNSHPCRSERRTSYINSYSGRMQSELPTSFGSAFCFSCFRLENQRRASTGYLNRRALAASTFSFAFCSSLQLWEAPTVFCSRWLRQAFCLTTFTTSASAALPNKTVPGCQNPGVWPHRSLLRALSSQGAGGERPKAGDTCSPDTAEPRKRLGSPERRDFQSVSFISCAPYRSESLAAHGRMPRFSWQERHSGGAGHFQLEPSGNFHVSMIVAFSEAWFCQACKKDLTRVALVINHVYTSELMAERSDLCQLTRHVSRSSPDATGVTMTDK